MNKPTSLLPAFLLITFFSYAQKFYWQQQVNFLIEVSLNDTEHTLDGFEKIEYINHSPDTLHYIWFHLWPNAYRNDKTAFSDQQIQNGHTDFYFSGKDQKGYINRLDFRINGAVAKTEDHPQYIDIIKLVLPKPLAPGETVNINTPFHVQLPFNFSRGGHVGQAYQVTQWFPKPAVYDRTGWHPMPYLDQGEFYSDFGNYEVSITVPKNYVVAATGELQTEEEKTWLLEQSKIPVSGMEVRDAKKKIAQSSAGKHSAKPLSRPAITTDFPSSDPRLKTIVFKQDSVHDFAWFADKRFVVRTDTIMLSSGRQVKAFAFYLPTDYNIWNESTQMMKDAIHFHSRYIGEYPYNVVSTVEARMGIAGGMEYPTITSISPLDDKRTLEEIINHELGHNWFQGVLATNERQFPWMDEGINTFYDLRYVKEKYGTSNTKLSLSAQALAERGLDTWMNWKKDQPIATPAPEFSEINYGLIAYFKAARWMQEVERYVGRKQFDLAMHAYFAEWQFKHPYPEDLKKVLEEKTGKDLSSFFNALYRKNSPVHQKRKLKAATIFSLDDYRKYTFINIFPTMGFNLYDGFMVGLGFHNYNLPSNKFQFVLLPLYATSSRQFNGIGRMSYSWFPDTKIYKVEAGINGGRFSSLKGVDSNGRKIFGGFYKVSPFMKIIFNNHDPRSKTTWWLEARNYFIGEHQFRYVLKRADSNYYPTVSEYQTRYLNQLTVGVDNFRKLYPYEAQLQLQQGKNFYRLNITGNYFFNYTTGGGLNLRVFAAKFGYIGAKTPVKQFETSIYQPKLTAVRGDEDYTYSNYFIGRNEHSGFTNQQIMMREGDLKLRTDIFQGLQGRSDNWVAAINLNTSLPNKLFPVRLPLKLFLDVGTYAEAWDKNASTSRFLYVGGLQLSLIKGILNFYAPILFSKEFRDQLKTVPDENNFLRRMSFSIDLQKINFRRYINQAQLY